MIKHLRIDNRLIHGQVAISWKNQIGSQAIIVCNDQVAVDPLVKRMVNMAAKGAKVMIFTIAQTIEYVQNHPEEPLFVICKTPSDALALVSADLPIEYLNVGNAMPVSGTKYIMATRSIAVTKEDAAIYRMIAEKRDGILVSKMVPTSEEIDFLQALKNVGL